MTEEGKLAGKVAVVTGAGSSGPGVGTGKAISVLFAEHGAQVVLVDNVETRAADSRSLIEAGGGTASVCVADLRDPAAAESIVAHTIEAFGAIDVLVNNAAITSSTSLVDTTPELYADVIAVNLTAPFFLTQAVIPHMVARGGGSIVNIMSIAAMRGQGGRGRTAYATSKAGMWGLMVDVADAYGSDGIRMNTVAPGIIDTPMRAEAMRQGGLDPSTIDLSSKTSLGFEGDAWDIARAVLFLAGPDGRYITGVLLPVDGGTTARSH